MISSHPCFELCVALHSLKQPRADSFILARVRELRETDPTASGIRATALIARDCASLFPRFAVPDTRGAPIMEPYTCRMLACGLKRAFTNLGLRTSYRFPCLCAFPAIEPGSAETLRPTFCAPRTHGAAPQNYPHLTPEESFELTLQSRRLLLDLLDTQLPAELENAAISIIDAAYTRQNHSEKLLLQQHDIPRLHELANAANPSGAAACNWLASLRDTQWDNDITRHLISHAAALQEARRLETTSIPRPFDPPAAPTPKRASL